MDHYTSIITDQQLKDEMLFTNFGLISNRDVVNGVVLKCASGFDTGYIAKKVAINLGLVTEKFNLTKKGKLYLFAVFSEGRKM